MTAIQDSSIVNVVKQWSSVRSTRWPALVALPSALALVGCIAGSSDDGTDDVTFTDHVHVMPLRDQDTPDPSARWPTLQSAPPGAHLTYNGGKVIQNVNVTEVRYGSGTYIPELTSTPPAVNMVTAYTQMVTSGVFDWLSEYNTTSPAQTIGRGTVGPAVQITPAASRNGTTIVDSSIQAELAAQISSGVLPAPTDNQIYMVHFPSGKTIIDPLGTTSCVPGGFCAYHGTFKFGTQNVYYAALPDFTGGCAVGCGNGTTFQNTQSAASHELVEAITDAEVGLAGSTQVTGLPLAWFDPINDEIGDICNQQQTTYLGTDDGTYTVQMMFSNLQNDCVGPPFEGAPLNWGAHGDDIALVGGNPSVSQLAVAFSADNGSFGVTNATLADFNSWARAPGVQRLTGDFNNDGRTDFALIGGPGWNTIPVAFSLGDGTFQVLNAPAGPSFNAWSLTSGAHAVVGDFNHDGYSDIALVGGAGWNTIPVAFAASGGTWQVTNNSASTFGSWASTPGVKVLVGDFNKDGFSDIALTGVSGWTVIPVAFGWGGGTWFETLGNAGNFSSWAAMPGAQVRVGDFNKDGYSDIVVTGMSGRIDVPIAFGWGGGSWNVIQGAAPNFASWATTPGVQLLVGDFNKDGYTDLALTGVNWNTIPIAMSAGNGAWQVTNNTANGSWGSWASTSGVHVLAGDFNGDGFTDIALTGANGWGSIPVAFSTGFGNFNVTNNSVRYFPKAASDPAATIAVGRFN